jgi:hypothetical protein
MHICDNVWNQKDVKGWQQSDNALIHAISRARTLTDYSKAMTKLYERSPGTLCLSHIPFPLSCICCSGLTRNAR